MNRGRRREDIFLSRSDYESFLQILKETSEGWNIRIAAYCLMPNHYHLLVHTPDGNISRCMRHINGVYTQRFNRRHSTDGQLFRGRYKAVLVEADNHLLEVLRYIHRNPIRAGLARTPKDFLWTSYQGYLSAARKWDWLEKEFLLSMFSERKTRRKAVYKNFLSQGEPEEIERFYSLKNLPSILGGDIFKDQIKEKVQPLRYNQEIPGARILNPTAEEIISRVCAHFRVSKEQIAVSRRGTGNLQRDLAIYLVRTLTRETLTEVGKHFGIDRYSTVSSVVTRVKESLKNDRILRDHLEKIRKRLQKS